MVIGVGEYRRLVKCYDCHEKEIMSDHSNGLSYITEVDSNINHLYELHTKACAHGTYSNDITSIIIRYIV